MALFDDRRFLLSHINHSFITGDDTGICEVVMLDEDVFENQHQRCLNLLGQGEDVKLEDRLEPEAYDLNYDSELFESEQGLSYDIASDIDYICHRRRSNTAQRLDRLKKEKINQSKTRTIVWRCNSSNSSQSEERSSHDSPTGESDKTNNDYGIESAATNRKKSASPPHKSGLTRLLERYPSLPKNPFSEYAQFDGGMSESVPVKKIMIFIALENDPNNQVVAGPLEVVIVSTAKVQDLVGLICWQYTNEGMEPKLHHDIDRYCLRIAEDSGEVDPDFTSLNPKEPLSKFNFPSLALTEKTEERVRTYNEHPSRGECFSNKHDLPTISHNVITSGTKPSSTSKGLAAITRFIFKDAKLNVD